MKPESGDSVPGLNRRCDRLPTARKTNSHGHRGANLLPLQIYARRESAATPLRRCARARTKMVLTDFRLCRRWRWFVDVAVVGCHPWVTCGQQVTVHPDGASARSTFRTLARERIL
jgi:hypothetical protein